MNVREHAVEIEPLIWGNRSLCTAAGFAEAFHPPLIVTR